MSGSKEYLCIVIGLEGGSEVIIDCINSNLVMLL